jgi:hypothetical protein
MINLHPKSGPTPDVFKTQDAEVKKYFLTHNEIKHNFSLTAPAQSVELVTTYFDTADGRLFSDQYRKTKRRFKIRSRSFNGSAGVIEIKVKGSLNPKRFWISEPGLNLENGGREFIRKALDEAFDPLFARRIEQDLRVVATTKFDRSRYFTDDEKQIFDFDENLVLTTNNSLATIKSEFTLLEVSRLDRIELVPLEWKSVKFSKFGATLDLLTGDRVRSHKLGILDNLFEIKQFSQ